MEDTWKQVAANDDRPLDAAGHAACRDSFDRDPEKGELGRCGRGIFDVRHLSHRLDSPLGRLCFIAAEGMNGIRFSPLAAEVRNG